MQCSAATIRPCKQRYVNHLLFKATRSFMIAVSSDTTRNMSSRSCFTHWKIPGCIAKAFVVAYPVCRAMETSFPPENRPSTYFSFNSLYSLPLPMNKFCWGRQHITWLNTVLWLECKIQCTGDSTWILSWPDPSLRVEVGWLARLKYNVHTHRKPCMATRPVNRSPVRSQTWCVYTHTQRASPTYKTINRLTVRAQT